MVCLCQVALDLKVVDFDADGLADCTIAWTLRARGLGQLLQADREFSTTDITCAVYNSIRLMT